MYKSILASALITLSASSAFAYDWMNNFVNAGMAAQIQQDIRNQISYDVKYASQYFKHRRNGATEYNAATYAAFNASEHIGYDGTGIDVLLNDNFQRYTDINGVTTVNEHGAGVHLIASTFAPGANYVEGINANTHANRRFDGKRVDEYDVINESFGSSPYTSGDDAVGLLGGSTGATHEGITLTDFNSFAQLHQLSLDSTIQYNANYNSLYVTAASNDGAACDTLLTCNHVLSKHTAYGETFIAVGALNDHGTDLDGYSNRAGLYKDVYLAAPVAQLNNKRGTSYAAPIVTAAAALVMDQFGTNAVQTRDILLDTADDLGAPGTDAIFGRGRLNVHRALSPIGTLR